MVVIVLLVTGVLELGRPEIGQFLKLFEAGSKLGVSSIVLPGLVNEVINSTVTLDNIVIHIKMGPAKIVDASLHVVCIVHIMIIIIA